MLINHIKKGGGGGGGEIVPERSYKRLFDIVKTMIYLRIIHMNNSQTFPAPTLPTTRDTSNTTIITQMHCHQISKSKSQESNIPHIYFTNFVLVFYTFFSNHLVVSSVEIKKTWKY